MNETKPWPLMGYAPGVYSFTCSCCGKHSMRDGSSFADKRATMCLECAVAKTKDRIATLEAENERLRKALEEVQAAQSSNHGCMATILSDISKIAESALEAKP